MPGEYYMVWRRPGSGLKVAEIDDARQLSYGRRVNAADQVAFELYGKHPKLPLLEDDMLIEVWRRVRSAGIAWHIDALGIYRAEAHSVSGDSMTFTATCPGVLDLLADRVVAWQLAPPIAPSFTTSPVKRCSKTWCGTTPRRRAAWRRGAWRTPRLPT